MTRAADVRSRPTAGARRGGVRIPVSTYRLQLNAGFTFDDAARLVPYLARLGVTDVYCSPYLQAIAGSPHGYDVTDHSQLRVDLGGEDAYRGFATALAEHGMGQLLDFVPNHMSLEDASANRWWGDVLENGTCSPYARFFDIDWDPVKPELKGRVLLPILGDQYGRVLERGELSLGFRDGALRLRYFEREFPVNPRRTPRVLREGLDGLRAELGEEHPDLREFLSILTELDNLPSILESDPERVAERQREKEVARDRLARLSERSPRIRRHIEECVRRVNGKPGDPASFDRLHELLELQPYRLAYWRTAFHEINYRRFFDVNALISVRMEDADVFEAAHRLVLRLVREGSVTGIRLDHVDGLFDPLAYLERLRQTVENVVRHHPAASCQQTDTSPLNDDASEQTDRAQAALPIYVVAEKILSSGESLPTAWPLHGTTGYDFLNDLNRTFVDPRGQKAMLKTYARFTGRRARFDDVVYESKKAVMESTLASELNVLAYALNRISEGDRSSRDFTLASLHDMLLEVVAYCPVYRTYITPAGHTESDRHTVEVAVGRARRHNPGMDASIFDFLRDVLLDRPPTGLSEEGRRQRREFAMKFQQYTGPVQAKGLEDTAFYRYNVLLSLNEVGGAPQRFGAAPSDLHQANRLRRERWPHAMLCTATHDTKRGEDARARLNVLSEITDEWARQVSQWARLNAPNRTRVDDEWAPDRSDEYLFYQALVGTWPAGETNFSSLVERLRGYMIKAIREAKVHTSWINENRAYEQAVADFAERTLTGRRCAAFLESFVPFAWRAARAGMTNSLAQLTLKLVSPGVPDFYQGTELWDLSLVDPDNRRPVDFAARASLLAELEPLLDEHMPADERAERVAALVDHWDDGRIKLYVTAVGLRLRRREPDLFLQGSYLALEAEGERAEHVVAAARGLGDTTLVAIVPRLTARLAGGDPPLAQVWGSTRVLLPPELARRRYCNSVTGEEIAPVETGGHAGLALASVLRVSPVALLKAVAA